MRALLIKEGVVVNVAEVADGTFQLEGYSTILSEKGDIGWLCQHGKLIEPVPTLPTVEEAEKHYLKRLDDYCDAKAAERRYDDRKSCAMRAGYPGPYQAEGQAFASWMDNCNALAYRVMAEAKSGERSLPSFEELIALLPALEWPA